MMRVFVSWSGDRSGELAQALAGWLPKVIQFVRPWISSASVDPGTRWGEEVGKALEELQCGILCLTPENLTAPWILFEAGALSKAVSTSRVIPYLLGFEPRELKAPLSQFQATSADEHGTMRLVSAINAAQGESGLADEALAEAFTVWWPKLSPELGRLASQQPVNIEPPRRSAEDMLGEVLQLLRVAANRDIPRVPLDLSWDAVGKNLSNRLLKLRMAKGFSQKQLSYLAGISQSHMSAIESGTRRPSLSLVMALANALGTPARELLDADGTSRSGEQE